MSSVPAEIAGIGSTSQRLRVSPSFDPMKAGVGPEEYFLLSRIDGTTPLRMVLLDSGLPTEKAVAIIQKLRSLGAVLLPNEASAPIPVTAASNPVPRSSPAIMPPPPSAAITPPTQPPRRAPASSPSIIPPAFPPPPSAGSLNPPTQPPRARPVDPAPSAAPTVTFSHDLSLPNATAEEKAALAEDIEMTEPERRRLLAMARLLGKNDPYKLLGVSGAADAKTLKRAYFLLSKEIHPDRHYNKRTGSFKARLVTVFEATSRAYNQITGAEKKSQSSARTPQQDQPQTPQEYAAELFDRACQLEVGGDAMGAMKLFAAAVRIDPQGRYLRRATSCALTAGQPRTALEYAKKANSLAPNDVSSARLLAAAFRACGKLNDAEEVLVMAMALKNENDTLTSELRNDLSEVRRLIAAGA
ncbi:MAG TPA: DnaJ domain-containing protein [Kofleriaceae bacterium]